MEAPEFDHFAEEYYDLHSKNIALSGEPPEYFAEYKIIDIATQLQASGAAPRTILDFGSGVGNSVAYFRKYFPMSNLTCADVSERSLDLSRKLYPGSERYVRIDENHLPFLDNSFDVIFSACVFHHITHDEHVHWLSELYRVAAPGGKLFIFEHNPLNPLTVSAIRTCPFDKNAELIYGRTFAGRVANARWSNVKVRYRIFFPRMLRILRGLERFFYFVPVGAQYYVSATKDASPV